MSSLSKHSSWHEPAFEDIPEMNGGIDILAGIDESGFEDIAPDVGDLPFDDAPASKWVDELDGAFLDFGKLEQVEDSRLSVRASIQSLAKASFVDLAPELLAIDSDLESWIASDFEEAVQDDFEEAVQDGMGGTSIAGSSASLAISLFSNELHEDDNNDDFWLADDIDFVHMDFVENEMSPVGTASSGPGSYHSLKVLSFDGVPGVLGDDAEIQKLLQFDDYEFRPAHALNVEHKLEDYVVWKRMSASTSATSLVSFIGTDTPNAQSDAVLEQDELFLDVDPNFDVATIKNLDLGMDQIAAALFDEIGDDDDFAIPEVDALMVQLPSAVEAKSFLSTVVHSTVGVHARLLDDVLLFDVSGDDNLTPKVRASSNEEMLNEADGFDWLEMQLGASADAEPSNLNALQKAAEKQRLRNEDALVFWPTSDSSAMDQEMTVPALDGVETELETMTSEVDMMLGEVAYPETLFGSNTMASAPGLSYRSLEGRDTFSLPLLQVDVSLAQIKSVSSLVVLSVVVSVEAPITITPPPLSPPEYPPLAPPAIAPLPPAAPLYCSDDAELVARGDAVVQLTSGSPGFPVSGSGVLLSVDEHLRTFGFFRSFAPGASGLVSASAVTLSQNVQASYQLGRPAADRAVAVIRTPILYEDRNSLRVAYQLHDEAGNTQVLTSGLETELTVSHEGGALVLVVSGCPLLSTSGGVGECEALLSSEWFAVGATASVSLVLRYAGGAAIASLAVGSVTLRRTLPYGGLDSSGMYIRMARAPLYPADEFSAHIDAHTGPPEFALQLWRFTLLFDASVVRLKSWTYTTLYETPIEFFSEAGELIALASNLREGVELSAVSGQTSLRLADLVFEVLADVTPNRVYERVLNMTVNAMINQGAFNYLSDAPAEVVDFRGGNVTSGWLQVEPVSVVGLFAYAQVAELVNTAVLDGIEVESSIAAFELRDRAVSTPSLAAADAFHCTVDGAADVLSLTGSCLVQISGSHSGGAAEVVVRVSSLSGGAPADVRLRVWYPSLVEVVAEDVELNRIHSNSSLDCARPAYQTTTLTAVATFGGSALPNVAQVDVSHLISFTSSSNVVLVSGDEATGLAVGSTTITLPLVNTSVSILTLAVSDVAVSVVELRGIIITGVEWVQRPPSTIPWAPVSTQINASVRLFQRLRQEGATGEIQAVARFSDGKDLTVPHSELSVLSLSPDVLALSPAAQGAAWSVEVATGATAACGALVLVRWTSCNSTIANGTAPIRLDLPDAISMQLSVSVSRLTAPDDTAAVAPISLPHTAQLRVTVFFSDNTQRDFTFDSRVVVSIQNASGCATYSPSTIQVQPGASCATVSITASIGSFGLTASISVPLVRFAALELAASPYPSFPGSTAISVQTLRRVACSTYYQNAQLRVRARLTDDSLVDVSSFSTVTASGSGGEPAAASIVSNSIVRPSRTGLVDVQAVFDAQASAIISITVVDEAANATQMTFTLPALGSGSVLSFVAVNGTRAQSAVALAFDDGTIFPNALAVDWIPVSALVSFSSNLTSAVTSDALGGFTLLLNHWELIVLRAQLVCTQSQEVSVQGALSVAANLRPRLGDVDIGSQSGLQFQQQGAQLVLPVRANAQIGRLVAYQVDINFDSSVLAAQQCTSGAVNGFTCTINDPINRVRLVGVDLQSSVSGSEVLLGTVVLQVVSSAVTLLEGEIVELVRYASSGSTQIGRVFREPMFAGRGFAALSSSGRRRAMSLLPLPTADSAPRQARRLAPSCIQQDGCLVGRWGDVNGDCDLTAIDVLVAYEVNISRTITLGELCPWAQQQLDMTRDGLVATEQDGFYLQRVVADKFRILVNASFESSTLYAGSTNDVVVVVQLFDSASEPAVARTGVRLEIEYQGDAVYSGGSSSAGQVASSGNWLANASHVGGGLYRTAVHPASGWELRTGIGVAVMVETVDALGLSDGEREFPFLGSKLVARGDAVVQLTSGSPGFPVSGSGVLLSVDERLRTFGFFRSFAPGASGLVSASAVTLSQNVQASYQLGRPAADRAVAVIRTPILYEDRNSLRVAYQLHDEAGNTQVLTSGLETELTVSHEGGALVLVVSGCPLLSTSGGVGECEALLSSEWFAVGATASVSLVLRYAGGAAIASLAVGSVTLRRTLPYGGLDSSGMYIRMARAPLYPADEFSAHIDAHTGPPEFTLQLWRFTLLFDASVVRLKSWTYTTLYETPIEFFSEAGELIALASNLREGVELSAVSGQTSLRLADLVFEVLADVTPNRVYERVLNMTVNAMINQGAFNYLSDAPAEVVDFRGGNVTSGWLQVEPVSVVGLFAYAQVAELVNTAVLDGIEVESSIAAFELRDRAVSTPSLAAADAFNCTVDGAADVLSLTGSCLVQISGSHSGGAAEVVVRVSSLSGGAPADVRLRVWYPSLVEVVAEDVELNRIHSNSSLDCARPAYQTTTLTAVATFGGSALPNVAQVDVSHLISFTSSSNVVLVSGDEATGLAVGSTTITLPLVNTSVSILTLAVSDVAVSVVELRGIIITGVEWVQRPPSTIPWAPVSTQINASVRLFQRLRQEGATGEIQAVARFSDGKDLTVPHSELSVLSLSPDVLALSPAAQGAAWSVEVATGATAACGALVLVRWTSCNSTIASGTASIRLDLPDAISMQLSVSVSRLTAPDDTAAVAPISLPHTAQLRVTVFFSDNTQRDFTFDSRVVVSIQNASGCATYSPSTIQVQPGASCATVSITASIGSFGLTASISVPLVRFAALELAASPYPSFPGSTAISVQTLRRVACSTYYQNAQLRVRARLTDDSLVDVSSFSTVTASGSGGEPAAASIVSNSIVRPSRTGLVDVQAVFDAQASAIISITVVDEAANATQMTFTLPALGSGSVLSFVAVNGTRAQSAVALAFDDGTIFPNALAVDWIPVSALVSFSSNLTSAVTSDALGGFTLLLNHWELIVLRAQLACTQSQEVSVQGALSVAANLRPRLGDVDIGSQSGLQFQQQGAQLVLPVRANAQIGRLVTYQVDINFDSSVLAAQQCTSGAVNGFTCTINDPINRVRLVGVDLQSSVSGSEVLLGTVVLQVVSSAVTLLEGEIVELVRYASSGSTQIGRVFREPMFAGRGFAALSSSGRRRAMSLLPLPTAYSAPRQGRRLAPSCIQQDGCLVGRWGDVNGDCDLTAIDVLVAYEVNIGRTITLGELCPWAQQQLDMTRDGLVATEQDGLYLQRVLADKFRILVNASFESSTLYAGSTNDVVVVVQLFDSASEPAVARTGVRLEIEYQGDAVYSGGSSSAGQVASSGNWLANASHVGGGLYRTAVHPASGWELRTGIGVAVMVETVDALGLSDGEREFPFLGSKLVARGDAVVQLTSGSPGFPVSGSGVLLSVDERLRTFGFFRSFAPGASGLVSASAVTLSQNVQASYQLGRPAADRAVAVIRTPILYEDRNSLRVAYQLHDEAGNTQVLTSGLETELTVSHEGGALVLVVSGCPLLSTSGGVGECEALLSSEWFAVGATASVSLVLRYAGGAAIASLAVGSVTLRRTLPYGGLDSSGMYIRMARAPLYPADEFSAHIDAHTGPPEFALQLWRFTLLFDASVVRLKSWSFTTLYDAPIDFFSEAGELIALASNLREGVELSAVSGQTSLRLADLVFEVLADVTPNRVYERVLNMTVNAMINQGAFNYLSDAPAEVVDFRGGNVTSGWLQVEPVSVVGLFAYAQVAELVNTAVLDGIEVESSIAAFELRDRAVSTPSLAAADAFNCTVDGAADVLSLTGSCLVQISGSHSGGAAEVVVRVSSLSGGAPADVRLRVWYPSLVEVVAEDVELNRIHSNSSLDCARPAYQTTTLTAVATFGGSALPNVAQVDVSHLISFTSSSNVVLVSGDEATGLAVGSTTITLPLVNTSVSILTLAVSDVAVSVVELRGIIITGVEWVQRPPSTIPWALVSTQINASVRLFQRLRQEGATGEIQAVARFSDGKDLTVPHSELSVLSLSPDVLALSPAAQGAAWSVEVATGATAACGALVLVRWTSCNSTIASGTASIRLDLPDAISMQLSVSVSRLTAPDDTAAVAPISLPHTAQLRVTVFFSDNTQRDFTFDSRVVVSIQNASGCATYSPSTIQVQPGASCATVSITASIGSFGLTASISVPLVRFAALELAASPYPSFPGSTAISVQTLRRVACSTYYQNAQLRVRARLTDDSLVDVSSFSTVTASGSGGEPAAASIVSNSIVRPSRTGLVDVQAVFDAQASAIISITVVDEAANATQMTFTLPALGSGSVLSFVAVNGTRAQSAVALAFDDGTIFPNALAVDWIPVSALVSFSSNLTSAVTSDALGGFTLLLNHWELIVLRAQLVCTQSQEVSVQGALSVAANLRPRLGDVDIGSQSGLQFQQQGAQLVLPVRANAQIGRLVTYQVDINFDSSVLAAQQCTSGAVNGFTCTINDPINRVRLVGVDLQSSVSGSEVLLGTVVLQVVSSAVTLLEGEIVELVRYASSGSTQIGRVSREPMFAGRGFAALSSSGRRRAMSLLPLPTADSAPRQARRLAPSCIQQDGCLVGRWGDVNGDCDLTAIDVLVAYEVNIGRTITLGELCPWAQQQLDMTRDGLVATEQDGFYLQRVVADKFRILVNASFESSTLYAGSTNDVVVVVQLFDSASEPAVARTGVRLEIEYQGDAVYSGGSSSAGQVASSGNWLANASHVGGGLYRTAVHPASGWELRTGIGVAVMVETVDALGLSDGEREFPFLGSSAPPYSTVGYSFEPLLRFSISAAPSPPPVPPPPSPPPPLFPPPSSLSTSSSTSSGIPATSSSLAVAT
ncbi:hypothetical protein AB1Y20_021478 [Prymnesium parvum]|uniref:Transmembrane protein family 132 fourth domain-containing protein n=1 Tax=Prymnesium parvum TaxID=97485 RepID=A0AB34JM64_PRYPA